MLSGARRSIVAAAARAVAASAFLAGCGEELGAPTPATEQGESIVDLWRALLIAATALGLIVVVLAGFGIVRYRERRHQRDEALPYQGHGNGILEAVYVAIPALVVAGFFAYTLRIGDIVNDTADDADVVVDVTGYRWGWRFEYPDEAVVIESIAGERPELVLPVDSTIRFHLGSDDVIHSFFVPSFLTKRDVIPGLSTSFDVDTRRTGTFRGHCAEFCGLDHARMNFTVVVVEQAEYGEWLDGSRVREQA